MRGGHRLATVHNVPRPVEATQVNGYYKAELIYGPARSGPWKTVEDVELAAWAGCTGTTPPATATSAT